MYSPSITGLEALLQDARETLNRLAHQTGQLPPTFRLQDEDLEWYAWPQGWGDTTCGHSGCGGQALSSAQTITVVSDTYRIAAVYHAGRLAHTLHPIGQGFWEALDKRRLPGKRGNLAALLHGY